MPGEDQENPDLNSDPWEAQGLYHLYHLEQKKAVGAERGIWLGLWFL